MNTLQPPSFLDPNGVYRFVWAHPFNLNVGAKLRSLRKQVGSKLKCLAYLPTTSSNIDTRNALGDNVQAFCVALEVSMHLPMRSPMLKTRKIK